MATDVAIRDAATVATSSRSAAAGSGIGFDGVTVSYHGTVVLDSFTLAADPGEILALIGPSGSGKTTALRALAGFVRPARGRVRIGHLDVTDLPPFPRGIGMVVQNYALFPHMRVEENVAFGLRARGAPRAEIAERVRECLRMVGMLDYVRRLPRELSGGQQQRVAIARALAIRPRVLLLDEPLSALDAQIRRSMVEELARLHHELPNLTVLYVTHDQTEALTLADRIGIMRGGRLTAFGSSQMLYRKPPNRFAAEFLGRANLLRVRLDSARAADGFARVRFGEQVLTAQAAPEAAPDRDCLLCIRPHDIRLQQPHPHANALSGMVQTVQWQGDLHSITLEARGAELRVVSPPLREPPAPGMSLTLYFAAEDATLIAEEDGGDA